MSVRSPPAPDEVGHVARRPGGRAARRGWRTARAGRRGEDRDPVAEPDRLVDVVGHQHHGLAELVLESQELVLQPATHDRVDRAERLVHQQHGRVGRERPGHADALALAAGELVRVAVGVPRGSRPTVSSSSWARSRAVALDSP